MIATTQAELGLNPRQRSGEIGKLKDDERAEQLAALETVGERFHAVVVKTAKDKIEGPDRGGRELNRRTTFARTSLSAIRRWVKAGNDITSLVAGRVTKRMLATASTRKGKSPKVLTNQTRRFGASLEATLATLAAADPDAAREQWMKLKARMERIFARKGNVTRLRAEHRVSM
ncbi:MAG: hypothetical protein ACREXP_00010 [Steroidobacteraceae bacterium]